MIIFLDESGDLGFDFNKPMTSRKFVITLLVCDGKGVIDNYVENQMEALLPLNIPLNIYHERSHENAGLQIVDLFCWGIFRKYEKDETDWYDVYRNMIVFETEYLC